MSRRSILGLQTGSALYHELGVRPVLNANTTLSRLGGSRTPEPVVRAMAAASHHFVDLDELQVAVGARLAELTRNEAAYVSAGASAGLFLAALATMTGPDERLIERVAQRGPGILDRREIVVQAGQRNPYDRALCLAGAVVVQIGGVLGTSALELEAALGERTAAVVVFAGEHLAAGTLDLAVVCEVAHRAGVPVVVDAAAQLPPVEHLWSYTAAGADLAIFSGGKGLRGPASSGLIVGRADLIAACRLHGPPHQRLGRPMKIGREEIVGLLAAVEWFLGQDHRAEAERIERTTARWVERLGRLPGVTARRDFPGEAGRPVPRAHVSWSEGPSAQAVARALRAGNPAVDVAVAGPRAIYLNAELLGPGEDAAVLKAVATAFAATGVGKRGDGSGPGPGADSGGPEFRM